MRKRILSAMLASAMLLSSVAPLLASESAEDFKNGERGDGMVGGDKKGKGLLD